MQEQGTDAEEDFSERESFSERGFDYARTVALSDGIFAIALTLLVLSLNVPGTLADTHGDLWHYLRVHSSEFLSYAISFGVVARFWVLHHRFFRDVERIDGRLTVLNLAYLAFVAFVPFPTELLGRYSSQSAAVVLYAATIAIIATLGETSFRYAISHRLLTAAARSRSHESRLRGALVPAIFLVSIPIAFVDTTVAQLAWLGLVLVRRLPARWTGDRADRD